MSDRIISAQCPCGHTVTQDTDTGGMSQYGALAYKMGVHEPCPAITRNNTWAFDHGFENPTVPEVPAND